jgi:hypothetical protein
MRSVERARASIGAIATHSVVLLVLGGCEPPDTPPPRMEGLPPAAVGYLDPDRVATFRLEEGAVYRFVRSRSRPWAVHLLELDLRRCEIGFRVARGDDSEARLSVAELARRSGPGVIAAVNGDFFTPESEILGVEVSDGRMRGSGRSRPVFAWRPGQMPWVGPVEWSDGILRIGDWILSANRFDPSMQVVAGFPPLLASGRLVGDLGQEAFPDFASGRHPRTAIGMDVDRRRLWMVVVDESRESEGMTLPELAGLFRALGAGNAINLDGGTSSAMVVRQEVVNRSSALTGERRVPNALVVRWDPKYCS